MNKFPTIAANIFTFFFLIIAAQNYAYANQLSDADRPREDLNFLQELEDVSKVEKDHETIFSGLVKFEPKFSNRLVADLNFDDNYLATSKQQEYKELQTITRLFSEFSFNKNLFIRSFVRLAEAPQASENARRNASPNGSGDRTFENLGINLEELVAGYRHNNFSFVVGKFNLNFGTTWQQSFGIWYADIAKQYRQREKLGARATYNLGDSKKYGSYAFSISSFTNDRKNFDGSLINNRDSANKQSAVPGDTRSFFDSYCASLNAKFDFNKDNQLTYHFSFINLAVNNRASTVTAAKIADQQGITTAINFKSQISENFGLGAFSEYAEIKNLGGTSDISEKYLTTNLVGEFYRKFNLTFARANQKNMQLGANGFDTNLYEVSAGYSFDKLSIFKGLFMQIGHKYQTNDYKNYITKRSSNGVMAIYSREF